MSARDGDVRLYGHRGASHLCPENTLAAFARALEVGADALESDVHLTRDGHVVLSHDPDGSRMAGVSRAISASSLDEVQSWDVGWGVVDAQGDRPHAGAGHRIPTLHEVLEAFPDTLWNLDVKQTDPPMVDAVLEVIATHKAAERVQLASFSSANIRAILEARYAGAVALSRDELLLLFGTPLVVLRRLGRFGDGRQRRAQVPVRAGLFTLGSERFIEKCHALSVLVDFWTINEPSEAVELVQLGADGIMTDVPETLAPVMGDLQYRRT